MYSGNETLANEELLAFRSICETSGNQANQSARTFISRSKNNDSVPRTSASKQRTLSPSQKTGEKVIQMPAATQQISEYINQVQTRDQRAQAPKSSRPPPMVSPTYMPIESQKVFVTQRQTHVPQTLPVDTYSRKEEERPVSVPTVLQNKSYQ